MFLRSDDARRRLARLEKEVGRLERCLEALSPEAQSALAGLRLYRNLLRGVLRGRAVESGRKIVSIERWRLGFAPAPAMSLFGYLPKAKSDEAASAATPAIATRRSRRREHSADRVTPQ
jgi:hypothetical protein